MYPTALLNWFLCYLNTHDIFIFNLQFVKNIVVRTFGRRLKEKQLVFPNYNQKRLGLQKFGNDSYTKVRGDIFNFDLQLIDHILQKT